MANRYNEGLSDIALTPYVMPDCTPVWAQYTIRVGAQKRAAIIDLLKAKGVPTAVYYPKPLHRQTAYKRYPVAGNGLPVSERMSHEVLALPMHPYLDAATQDYIIAETRAAIAAA